MRPWLRLLRIALLPALAWDFLAAGLILGKAASLSSMLLPLAGVLALYHAGMVGNDLADRHADRIHRPNRPLPKGEISVLGASLLLLALLGLAAACAFASPRGTHTAFLLLAVLTLIYNFGGSGLRGFIGPPLLATARCLVLLLGGLVWVANPPLILLMAALSTAFYFLFLSRLATREEHGLPGRNAVVLVCSACFSPVLLLSLADHPLHLAWAWPLFFFHHMRPVWRDRHLPWSPHRVQAAVRRLLQTAPLLPSMALLAQGQLTLASLGLLACLFTSALARSLPPE